MAKTTKVQGTKFRISVGREAQKAITAINLNTATLTIASSGYKKVMQSSLQVVVN